MTSQPDPDSVTEMPRPVPVDRIPAEGTRFAVEASATEREALARRFNILGLDALSADVTLTRVAGGAMVRARVAFKADLRQACGVSLAPVAEHVEGTFLRDYAAAETAAQAEAEAGEDGGIDPDAAEPPEPIVGGMVDVGEALAEELALGMDPFPRAPDVDFEGYEARSPGASGRDSGDGEAEEKRNPFAALEALRGKIK